MPITLVDEFNKAMLDLYVLTKNETKRNWSGFYTMLQDCGGVNTAHKLLSTTKPSSGYVELWEIGRLDLTVEAYIWDNPNFQELFSPEELKVVQKRLTDYGYLK